MVVLDVCCACGGEREPEQSFLEARQRQTPTDMPPRHCILGVTPTLVQGKVERLAESYARDVVTRYTRASPMLPHHVDEAAQLDTQGRPPAAPAVRRARVKYICRHVRRSRSAEELIVAWRKVRKKAPKRRRSAQGCSERPKRCVCRKRPQSVVE